MFRWFKRKEHFAKKHSKNPASKNVGVGWFNKFKKKKKDTSIKDSLRSLVKRKPSKGYSGPLEVVWGNSRNLTADDTISRDIELLKKYTTNDIKKKFSLTKSKSELLDTMMAEYKSVVALTGLSEMQNGKKVSSGSLDIEKLNNMLNTYDKNRKKNKKLSLFKFDYYKSHQDDLRMYYLMSYLREWDLWNKQRKLSRFLRPSKFDKQILYMILDQYKASKLKKKSSSKKEIKY